MYVYAFIYIHYMYIHTQPHICIYVYKIIVTYTKIHLENVNMIYICQNGWLGMILMLLSTFLGFLSIYVHCAYNERKSRHIPKLKYK